VELHLNVPHEVVQKEIMVAIEHYMHKMAYGLLEINRGRKKWNKETGEFIL
jgi:hypothetical protein